MNYLDRLPQRIRELLIMLVSALLGWAAEAVTTLNVPGYVVAMASGVIGWAALNWTTLTRQYGVGSEPDSPETV
jgi:uncharacterized membrane protein YeaQ/YmgE (transglycosylase-associated protein family)